MADVNKTDEPFNPNDVLSITNSNLNTDDIPVIDTDWIRSRFMVPDSDIPDDYYKTRYKSTASSKYTDSSLGGNIGINPRPQFTRYCDIRDTGSITNKNKVTVTSRGSKRATLGMGRYYSEAIDDNTETIFMEFGVPKFNSLIDFFTRAIDYTDSVVANTGRPPIGYTVGKALGTGLMLAAFPLVSLSIYAIKYVTKLFTSENTFKYYYFDSSMHTYWSTVNQLVSNLAVELGLLIPMFMDDKETPPGMKSVGMPMGISQTQIEELKEILPDGVISDDNYIDVFAIATKSQRKAIKYKEAEYKALEAGLAFQDTIKKSNSILDSVDQFFTIHSYFGEVNKSLSKLKKGDEKTPLANKDKAATDGKPEEAKKFNKDEYGRYVIPENKEENSFLENAAKAFDSSLRQGGAFACFNVDFTGSTSESFSNTTSTINAGSTVKQMSLKARNIKFDMGGGNIIGDTQKELMDGVKGILAGALDSVTFGLSSVLQTLSGGGYIDLPKKWDDSSMTMPSITYKLQLISPYNNVVSQLQNIYIPLCMLLAGALPLAAGKSSYTSPFLCTLFNKGKQHVKLGMITSLSVTRGTSNLGFDKRKRPLAIDVSFTVTDFSTMITSPINTSAFGGIFNYTVEDDTPMGTYLNILGGRDLLSNKYALYKLKLKLSKRVMSLRQATSGYSYGMMGGNALESTLGAFVSVRSLSGQFTNKLTP